ncbi:TPA: hypothetical protein ACGR8A_005047, partial [Escherichia coli]
SKTPSYTKSVSWQHHLWFELVTKIDIDIHKKNRYASYDLRRKIEMQHEEFQKMTEREQVPLLKSPE